MKRKQDVKELGFKLNMQILVDAYEEVIHEVVFINKKNDIGNLIGARIYNRKNEIKTENVYIAMANELEDYDTTKGGSFVIIGELPECMKNSDCRCIILPKGYDEIEILNITQDIFDQNRKWDSKLQTALNNDWGLDELCQISIKYFNNPIFIHDSQFYILSCPSSPEGMTKWDKDERTGMLMVSVSLLNDFKIDKEFKETLETEGADMFSANQRGYRILYVNMWVDGHWNGRLCINEMSSSIKPGQYLAAEYFCEVIKIAISRRNMSPGSHERPFELVIKDTLKGKIADYKDIERRISYNNWHFNDKYVCIKVGTDERMVDTIGAVSTCNYIETHIYGSYAFLYEDSILVICNLNVAGMSVSECISNLAYIIREGLFTVGVSEVFEDFSLLPSFYKQACIAHDYGKKSGSMLWCHKFEEHALDYILDNACDDIQPKYVCLNGLSVLQKYDEKNETELFKTLKVYLMNERNAVHTAKELFIHRSTLFYRLDRIKELINVDLNDANTRLYINISYRILENLEKE